MQPTYTIKTLPELQALSDPLRLRLVQVFSREPLTPKQAAAQLGEPVSKLYHHVTLLEGLGLIEVVKTKQVRGTTERYYSSIARHFAIDDLLLAGQLDRDKANTLQGLLDGILSSTRAQLRDSIAAGLLAPENIEREGTVAQTTVHASPAEISKLERTLNKWLAGVRAADHPDGASVYGVTVFFFPLVQQEKTTAKKRAKK